MARSSSKLPLRPTRGNILVEPEEQETTTPSGLVLSSNKGGERPQTGKIVALGSENLNKEGKPVAWEYAEGDRIVFKKYSPDEIEMGDTKYLIMQEEDILAILA